jgi:LacI family transcriptional regulator
VIEDLANPFYSTIASAIARVARGHNALLITSSSEEDPKNERALLLDLCQRRVDGLLVVPASADHSFLKREIEMGIPAVFLDRPPTGVIADTVLIDNTGGARSGIELLLHNGHSRIGILLDSLVIYTMRERLAGVQAAVSSAGAPYDESLLRINIHEPLAASTAVGQMLDMASPPTAFFCGNNRITLGAVAELWRRGSDAELVGFDDFDSSELMPRPLTVVSYDNRELGRKGAELLFKRIGGDHSWPVTITLPTQLIKRGQGPKH